MGRKNLKEARQKAGMTQQQVAEYLGITTRSYQRIEDGSLLGRISLGQTGRFVQCPPE